MVISAKTEPAYIKIGLMPFSVFFITVIIEPGHEISNIVVFATSKASDQPAHMHSLIRVFISRLTIL